MSTDTTSELADDLPLDAMQAVPPRDGTDGNRLWRLLDVFADGIDANDGDLSNVLDELFLASASQASLKRRG